MTQVEVECPTCRRPRWVSPERATRIHRGVVPARCRSCKTKVDDALSAHFPPADFSEGDVRWWVESFGGTIPVNERPTAWVARHGMPTSLHELVASLKP